MSLCYKLILAYDGSCYTGWQSCNQGGSVEEALVAALSRLYGSSIAVEGASRTDAGVHALGQVVTFRPPDGRYRPNRLMLSLNSLLSPSLRVFSLEEESSDFHPTLSAIAKEYRYTLDNAKAANPLNRLTSWHLHQPLDLPLMCEAASRLIGVHDFSAFCNQRKGIRYQDKVRTLYAVDVKREAKQQISICMVGNSFLYKMARNIVGCLTSIGLKNSSIELLDDLFEHKNRCQAPLTAPAKGLVLEQIFYTNEELTFFLKNRGSVIR